ncbi:MAG: hypothetical protein ACD_72C00102G0003 [uncultured bacterium]|nr:MAG: hypothetical protein ACD_72C00102G0003 [uncultured bacterium]
MFNEEKKVEIQINDAIIDTIVNDLYLPCDLENTNKEMDERN